MNVSSMMNLTDVPETAAVLRAERVAEGFTFLEGPRWFDGALWASDFYSERVLRFAPDGAAETVCSVPGRPSGLGFTPWGELWIVSMLQRSVLRWRDGELSTVARFDHLIDGVANDMLVTAEGWALVGNFGNTDDRPGSLAETGLVRISPSGATDLVAPGLVFPNGMALLATDHGGRELVVAETFAGRLSAYEYRVAADGRPELGERRVWKQFGAAPDYLDIPRATASLEALPDGIAADASGAIWVASSNSTAAMRVAPDGTILETVDTGGLSTYSLTLGGADGRTLYLCCGPSLGTSDPQASTESVLMSARVSVPAA